MCTYLECFSFVDDRGKTGIGMMRGFSPIDRARAYVGAYWWVSQAVVLRVSQMSLVGVSQRVTSAAYQRGSQGRSPLLTDHAHHATALAALNPSRMALWGRGKLSLARMGREPETRSAGQEGHIESWLRNRWRRHAGSTLGDV